MYPYALPPPPPGPLGLFMAISQLKKGGFGSVALRMSVIQAAQSGQIALNPTQQQYGEMLTRAGLETPGTAIGGGSSESGEPGGIAACPESDPETTPVSANVQQRIDAYEARVRIETAPLGTAIPNHTWLELQSLSFKTPQGIRLARQLLWYVKAMGKALTGKASTKFRYNNRIIDLLDPKVEPASFDEINAKTPLFGEHIASQVSNAPETIIGSPFSSAETWEAIRTMRTALRGRGLGCQKAKGIPGDAWKKFDYFAKGVRGYTRVQIDGQSFEFRMAYHSARGAGPSGYTHIPGAGVAMTRNSFYTIEDRRITVEDRKAPRIIQANTIGQAVAEREAAELADAESRAAPTPIQSDLRLGGQTSYSSEVRLTQGGTMHVSTELEELFEDLLDLPPFRFDMPLRAADDYSELAQRYRERVVRLQRGSTQTGPQFRAAPTGGTGGQCRECSSKTGLQRLDPHATGSYSVTIPALFPPTSDSEELDEEPSVDRVGHEGDEWGNRLERMLADLSE